MKRLSRDLTLKMIRKSLLQLLHILLLLWVGCDGMRRWDFEPISMDSHTSDPNKLDIQLRIKRMSRGEFSYDGYVKYAYDVTDETMVEGLAYHSQSGREEDYVKMPWSIAKQSYPEYVKEFYEKFMYPNLGSCTNFPRPEDALPWKRGNYTLKECALEGKGIPDVVPQGYHKLIFTVSGEVDWGFECVVKITDKWL